MFFFLECKFKFTHEMGLIASPGFPFSYPSNIECTWLIKAPPMRIIQLSISTLSIGNTTSCGDSGYLEVICLINYFIFPVIF